MLLIQFSMLSGFGVFVQPYSQIWQFKNKIYLLGLVFIISLPFIGWSQSVSGNNTQNPSNTASIKWKNIRYGFGTVPYGVATLRTNFEFINTSNKPLQIKYVANSCGCTTNDWTKGLIQPGKTGIVSYVYDASRIGMFTKCADVYLNNGELYILTICGTVLPPGEMVDPDQADKPCGCTGVKTLKHDTLSPDNASIKPSLNKKGPQIVAIKNIPQQELPKTEFDKTIRSSDKTLTSPITKQKSDSESTKNNNTFSERAPDKSGFNIESFNLYPNPSVDEINVSFILSENKTLQISLYDISGKLVKILCPETEFQKGGHVFGSDIGDTRKGMYMVVIRSRQDLVWSQRFLKM